MTVNNNINRYSDSDLAEFKAAIEKDLAKSEKQLANLESQLESATETNEDQADYMDDSANSADIELLQTLASRQTTHITHLNNALQRVYNKSYGICIVTGELIDKRRLLAVPTTARSLAVKINPPKEKEPFKPAIRPTTGVPKIISRIISKPKPAVKPIIEWEEEDDDLTDDLELEDDMNEGIDFDSLSEEDLD